MCAPHCRGNCTRLSARSETAMASSSHSSSLSLDCPLLPGLPADLAMLCLAKLPLDAVARSRAVSRAWASALRKCPTLGRLPQRLAAFCRGKENDSSMNWLFLSPSDLRSLVIPFSFVQKVWTCIFTTRLQVIGTGMPLLLVRAEVRFRDDEEAHGKSCMTGSSDCREIVEDGHQVQGPGSLQGFDMWQMKWLNAKDTPWGPMPVDRWLFATAYLGKHVYFAGGEGDGLAAATTADRLHLDTWTWETLPPMHKERSYPSGFTMGGRFFVVGGESHMMSGTLPQSGEFYDPATNAWTLVPDMWPHELWWAFGGPQVVAVIQDVGYAIDQKEQAVLQLKINNPSITNMKWQMVGQLPWPQLDQARYIQTMSSLLSVQDELWAILNGRHHDSVVFACKPHIDSKELHWERLPFNITPSNRSTLTRGMDTTI